MIGSRLRHGLLSALVALLLASPALAGSSGVFDHAGFFSPEAIAKANAVISGITTRDNHDLVVETFGSIPGDLQSKFDGATDKEQFYRDWLLANAENEHVKGVYVLVVKDPSHLEAGIGSETKQRAFTADNRAQLVQTMLGQFKEKNFDQGLLDGVNYVDQTMTSNLAGSSNSQAAQPDNNATTPPVAPSNVPVQQPSMSHKAIGWGGLLCMGIFALVVFSIIRGAIRTAANRMGVGGGGYPPVQGNYPQQGYPQQGFPQQGYPQQQQGGGFLRGMLGGVLGGALGSYAYDEFGRRIQNPGGSNQGGNAGGGGSGGGDFNSGANTGGGDFGSAPDNSTSGGSFGDSGGGGGGDFGSGASTGGGDFGGGGGGGGDSGSSGGSF